jgi:TRAP-type mannitol/chloroaromatic compound transport system permease small subunit
VGRQVLLQLARAIDHVTERIGRVVAWLTLATVLICVATVYLRYALHIGLIWLQELYIWTHVTAIMLGAGYVLLRGGFVRVDVVYSRMGRKARAWVELIGTVFFMAPFVAMMAVSGWSFVRSSFLMREASQQETGLGALWLLKGTLIAFVAVVGLQGVAIVARSLATLLEDPQTAPSAIKDGASTEIAGA